MGLIKNIAGGLRSMMSRKRMEGEMDEELREFMDASRSLSEIEFLAFRINDLGILPNYVTG
jgi:hypothetical protein